MRGLCPQLTFCVFVMCSVGQQRSSQDMHAVLVEKTQKFCLLSFLKRGNKHNRKLSEERLMF